MPEALPGVAPATAAVAPQGYDGIALTDARFTLGDFAVTGLSRPEQADFLDITMSADDGVGVTSLAPVMVAFRFRLDSVMAPQAPTPFAVGDRRTPQPVA